MAENYAARKEGSIKSLALRLMCVLRRVCQTPFPIL